MAKQKEEPEDIGDAFPTLLNFHSRDELEKFYNRARESTYYGHFLHEFSWEELLVLICMTYDVHEREARQRVHDAKTLGFMDGSLASIKALRKSMKRSGIKFGGSDG